jgi:hypothetical protein
VDVLNKVHRWLRPGGQLLDLQPEPEWLDVEVGLRDARAIHLGQIDTSSLMRSIGSARAALMSVVDHGLFKHERELIFDFDSHFFSVDEWLRYRQARRSTSVLDPSIVDRARELLAADGAEVRVKERVRATRYRSKRAPD